MSENTEIEFVNREIELNHLSRSISHKTVIEAPAGFGKTYLLEAVKRKFLEEDTKDVVQIVRKGCAIIDLQNYVSRDGIVKIISEIAMQIANEEIKSPGDDKGYYELRTLLGNYDSILLMFDSVERSEEGILKELYEDILEDGLFDELSPKLKIVFAGRHLKTIKNNTDAWARRYLPRWEGYSFTDLKPFTVFVIEDFLRKRYERTKGIPQDRLKERFVNWSVRIKELSGGHPRTIKKLVDYLCNPKGGNWVADLKKKSERQARYIDFVQDEVKQVLEGVLEGRVREDLEKLSVFRIFNLNTIDHLKSIGEFKGRDAFSVFTPITRTGLVEKYPHSVFYGDSIIRNLLLSCMKNENPGNYERLNNSALNFFNNQIDEAIADNKRSKNRNMSIYVSEFIGEAMYHLSQIPSILFGDLVSRSRRYVGNLQDAGLADDNKDCREQIERIIGDDTDIIETIGRSQLEKLLDELFKPISPLGTPPPPVRSLRVFLCHASEDKPTVLKISSRLQEDGFNPWLDEKDILPGDNFDAEIRQAVHDSDVVMICLSPNSAVKSGYIQKEIKIILDVAEEKPPGTIFIIPVKLAACDIPKWPRIRKLQWVNYFEETGYGRMLLALQKRAAQCALIDANKK